ncbi:hypothetical protein Gohar_000627 [Gossypium harknessii]|uniref:Uncharacterized protein n=1 Tax=Gossypium harknessii TaxID=34285 RepID=A0A7J9I1A3_9ROSI|nr:hypothetical protein [Gossypium harknessii]
MVGTCELIDEVEDSIVWIHDKGRVFSVKKLSQLLVMMEWKLLNSRLIEFGIHDDCIFSEVDWWGQPKDSKSGKKLERDSDCVWDTPPTGWLKFNVAGVVLEEVVGCRGVLRDEKGVVFALFCGKCGVCGVEQVVVMVIKVAT